MFFWIWNFLILTNCKFNGIWNPDSREQGLFQCEALFLNLYPKKIVKVNFFMAESASISRDVQVIV